jgi:hypothetical protein
VQTLADLACALKPAAPSSAHSDLALSSLYLSSPSEALPIPSPSSPVYSEVSADAEDQPSLGHSPFAGDCPYCPSTPSPYGTYLHPSAHSRSASLSQPIPDCPPSTTPDFYACTPFLARTFSPPSTPIFDFDPLNLDTSSLTFSSPETNFFSTPAGESPSSQPAIRLNPRAISSSPSALGVADRHEGGASAASLGLSGISFGLQGEEGREGRKGMEKDGTIDWSLLSRRKSSLGRDDVVWRT